MFIKIIIIIINLLSLSDTSDPRQITSNMSVADVPLAMYNDLLRNELNKKNFQIYKTTIHFELSVTEITKRKKY